MDIAVVGMAARLPGSVSGRPFWDALAAGESFVIDPSPERAALVGDGRASAANADVQATRRGAFISDIDAFDADFFGVLPHVASTMDPQQRIMLELSWACLENAGVRPSALRGREIGVVIGVFNHDYKELLDRNQDRIEAHCATGVATTVIANRISHIFDLRGPSLPVDTACSSSLNAIHLAIQAIEQGDCEMALAGGINLLLTETRSVAFARMGMLSSTDACRSFDAAADGYVRGEGAAIILLKPLEHALRDGDTIHAVIKGSAVNHCGQTHTLTYPSATAQAQVIIAAHRRAGVGVASIGYVEAHGTGTPKGDPIEFGALVDAFQRLALEQGETLAPGGCGLGSVKSNLGHLEAAAGIVGLVKILLAFRNKALPGLHGFTRANPRIDLETSPFRIVAATEAWRRDAAAKPRRAGISSFGFGGTNAHIVLEEPPALPLRAALAPGMPVLIVLSAKDAQALRRRLADMLDWLSANAGDLTLAEAGIGDVAATLLRGREHFAFRFACVVASCEELAAALQHALDAGAAVAAASSSSTQADNRLVEQAHAAEPAVRVPALKTLGERYCAGVDLPWDKLTPTRQRHLPDLPSYPFKRDRFWLASRNPPLAHPLLGEGQPEQDGWRFRAVLPANEAILTAHLVDGQPILPAVVSLELVYAAFQLILAHIGFQAEITRLAEICWPLRLAPVDGFLKLELIFRRQPDQGERCYAFEIRDGFGAIGCSGSVAGCDQASSPALQFEASGSVSRPDAYSELRQQGLNYGPMLRVLDGVRSADDALGAALHIPPETPRAYDRCRLHPGLADAALQAAVLLAARPTAAHPKTILPFSLRSLELRTVGGMPTRVRVARSPAEPSHRDEYYDIDLISAEGAAPYATLRGLCLRSIARQTRDAAPAPEALFAPTWQPHALGVPATRAAAPQTIILVLGARPDTARLADELRRSHRFGGASIATASFGHTLDLTDPTAFHVRADMQEDLVHLVAMLKERGALPSALVTIAPEAPALDRATGLDPVILGPFALIQALMRAVRGLRLLHLVADPEPRPDVDGAAAFYRTLRVEKPSFRGRTVRLADPSDDAGRDAIIADELADEQDDTFEVRYAGGLRQTRAFVPLDPIRNGSLLRSIEPPIRAGATYLITGGLGGLGLIFAAHIVDQWQGHVVLTGRSPLTEASASILASLDRGRGRVLYRSCDLTDAVQLADLIAGLRAQGSRLSGVIHAAGVIEDDFILRKPSASFRRVVLPKTLGTVLLAEATRDEPLSFFALFSSVTGLFGNPGQSDYAYANGFQDSFAQRENRRHGDQPNRCRWVSINWPYWRDGGMRLDANQQEQLRRQFGLVPLETASGIAAFEHALACGDAQIAVMPGETARIHETLGLTQAAETFTPATGPTLVPAAAPPQAAALAAEFSRLFGAHLGVSTQFDERRFLRDYGIDSVVALDLIALLQKRFGPLPATLFFEYPTLLELAGYFLAEHGDVACALPPSKLGAAPIVTPASLPPETVAPFGAAREPTLAPRSDDVAIIGIAGRFPGAPDIETFWQNLRAGVDSVIEIPPDRWDLDTHHRPGAPVPGYSYGKWGGFLTEVDRFDAAFFNITPKETETMDPNEWLFLETAAAAIENAGYTPDGLAGGTEERRIGVFVGAMWSDYQIHGASDPQTDWSTAYSTFWSIPNRVSHFFNFAGPSMAVDTACSSSITALHLACSSLRSGESQCAIAGGVNLSLHPYKYQALANMHFLSTDGKCRAFGEGGSGYVPGEGVGAVLLKPLARAIADGDYIYGVIRGTTVNHGGKASGFTVPNSRRQASLIGDALRTAGVAPHHVSYIEAHGTGTKLGDPIEVKGLNLAYGTASETYCRIGSVKANIGHLEAAAGIAGLIKVLLQIQHRTLVPSIRSETLNPFIDFKQSPFTVQRTLEAWQPGLLSISDGHDLREIPRIAGLSSFGAGGSNGHLIVQEHIPPTANAGANELHHLFVLSARKEEALLAMAGSLASCVERLEPGLADDVAYTLQVGRIAHEHRLAVVASNLQELAGLLGAFASGRQDGRLMRGHRDDGRKRAQDATSRLSASTQPTLEQIGRAWCIGEAFDWSLLHDGRARRRVPLPGYAFQRQRTWSPKGSLARPARPPTGALPALYAHRQLLHPGLSWLRDHQLGSNAILPAAASITMALQARAGAGAGSACRVARDMQWLQPLLVTAEIDAELTFRAVGEHVSFELASAPEGTRILHARGVLESGPAILKQPSPIDLAALQRGAIQLGRDAIDDGFHRLGFNLGTTFRLLANIHHDDAWALAEFDVHAPPSGDEVEADPSIALLDAALRTCLSIGGFGDAGRLLQVPVSIRRYVAPPAGVLPRYALARHASSASTPRGTASFDIDLLDAAGVPIGCVEGLLTRQAPELGITARAVRVSVAVKSEVTVSAGRTDVRQQVTQFLVDVIAEATKLPAGDIEPSAPISDLGLDSIMIMSIGDRLATHFSDLSKTMFYEFESLADLVTDLIEGHQAEAEALAASATPVPAILAAVAAGASVEPTVLRLFTCLQQSIGLDAGTCHVATPLAEWPIDTVSHDRFAALARAAFTSRFDAEAIWRHETLEAWAAQLDSPIVAATLDVVAKDARIEIATATTRLEVVVHSGQQDSAALSVQTDVVSPNRSETLIIERAESAGNDVPPAPAAHGAIAIIGLSGRYPGADTLDAFWRNLCDGKDGISEFPHLERAARGAEPVAVSGSRRWGGFLSDIDQFDAAFFNISPREAAVIDPQERLFLQTAWECFEDACYPRSRMRELTVGVFVGVMWDHYQYVGIEPGAARIDWPMALHSAVANRVSYAMNLSGPSVAVDTMCSSSLTALHLACQAIRTGDCEMAIAGGVNLITHPIKYDQLGQSHFLSSDGRCRTFGAGGDGYVPGEGVGAVLLKPLERAIADGDQVLGVIRASALNHGGKTSGFTVPNQAAQTRVVAAALHQAGWHPATIQYVEAHGTGTSLGDPIEINGLERAFSAAGLGPEIGHCAIGSVKSNIGHLESAAGIAGLTKLLLQLRHRTIAPSLHSAETNPNIDFSRSPFRVPQRAEPWEPTSPSVPRRASLSAFGAGGSNAHLLIEAMETTRAVAAPLDKPVLFVLSADTSARLELLADRVASFVTHHAETIDLRDLAFASQVGRDAAAHRVALVAERIEDIAAGLRDYRAGVTAADLFTGEIQSRANRLDGLLDEGDLARLLDDLAARGDVRRLAALWTTTVASIDWERYRLALFPSSGGLRPVRRASFPATPFMTRRHWIAAAAPAKAGPAPTTLQPLPDAAAATKSLPTRHRYQKRFVASDRLVRDHVIEFDRPRHIVSGAASLEMIREAAAAASPDQVVARITDVLWLHKLEVTAAGTEVVVEVVRHGAAQAAVTIATAEDGVLVSATVHYAEPGWTQPGARLDLESLRQERVANENADAIYQAFTRIGLRYGPSYRVTAAQYADERSALCRLAAGTEATGTLAPDTVLHPGLLDGAFRAGLAIGANLAEVNLGEANLAEAGLAGARAMVPFALDAIEIRRPIPIECWAFATVSDDRNLAHSENSGTACDILILDAAGEVVASVLGFRARCVSRSNAQPRSLLYAPGWVPEAASAATSGVTQTVLVVSAEEMPVAAALHRQCGPAAHGCAADAASITAALRQMAATATIPDRIVLLGDASTEALAGLGMLQALVRGLAAVAPDRPVRCVYAFGGECDRPAPAHDAIAGAARSLLTVNHRLEMSTLRLDFSQPERAAAAIAAELATSGNGGLEICRFGEQRQVRRLRPLTLSDRNDVPRVPRNGVFLVTGGAGQLGLTLAEHLTRRFAARLLLCGRSAAPGEAAQCRIDAMVAAGHDVVYQAADIALPDEASRLVGAATERWGGLNGIFHCAGNSCERAIQALTAEDYRQVLGPKVDGLRALDRATTGLKLDLFVLFSSISATLGDTGAGIYAAANRFMDSFAEERALRERRLGRTGLTLSIGWPLWADGDMTLPEAEGKVLAFSGLVPMPSSEALLALDRLLADPQAASQVTVAFGERERIERSLRLVSRSKPQIAIAAPGPAPAAALPSFNAIEAVSVGLRNHIAAVTYLDPNEIAADATFDRLGMDSVMLVELAGALERDHPWLAKTALFEHDTVGRLATHIARCQPARAPGIAPSGPIAVDAQAAIPGHASPAPASRSIHPQPEPRPASTPPIMGRDVAVIGMAARLPGVADLESFWDEMRQGRDCLAPIDVESLGDPTELGTIRGGFIDTARFDSEFFGMTAEAAAACDPQLRLVLQTAWEALEDAAYTPQSLRTQRVGVYVGVMNEDWSWIMAERSAKAGRYLGPGAVASELANRISSQMDFNGPSMTVAATCASSATAIHLARAAILAGECDVAIAGGVNLSLHRQKYLMLKDMKVLSPDGVERTFDEAANGLVPSDGCGLVVLKAAAATAGDRVHGIIRASRLSHAGAAAGRRMPNLRALEDTIALALSDVGADARHLGFLEASGAGTSFGDPIELQAVTNALARSADAPAQCLIGTKAGFGHMEAASGVASLIKVLLALRHDEIPPCANLGRQTASFEQKAVALRFPRAVQPWVRDDAGGRLAGVNSFGMGGSQVFMVVGDGPAARATHGRNESGANIVVLSARGEEQLRRYACALAAHLDRGVAAGVTLDDIAFTSRTGRTSFARRLAIVADSLTGLRDSLQRYADATRSPRVLLGAEAPDQELRDLLQTDAGQELVRALVRSDDHTRLARLWLRGADIDWTALDESRPGRRVGFPTYPFDNQPCVWADPPVPLSALPTEPAAAWFARHEPAWSLPCPGRALPPGEAGVAQNARDLAKSYWIEHEGAWSQARPGLAAALGRGAVPDAADAPPGVTLALSGEQVRRLQRATETLQIDLECLVACAWAILMTRHTGARVAQFGLLSGDAAEIVPVGIDTGLASQISLWATDVGRDLGEKHCFARASTAELTDWFAGRELFDSIVAVTRDASLSALPAKLRLQVAADASAVTLHLRCERTGLAADTLATLLERLSVVLLELGRHPERKPAAVPMRTEREAREGRRRIIEQLGNGS